MAKKKKSKKLKKDKSSPDIEPESVLGSESPTPKKAKGENVVDRTESKKQDTNSEHYGAVRYLEFEPPSTPATTPATSTPPTLLLALIKNFLTGYGFDSTSRIFQIELASKMKFDGWETDPDRKIPSKYPDLVKVFRQQHKEYSRDLHIEETSSSEFGDDDNDESLSLGASATFPKGAVEGQMDREEDTTSSGSSSDVSEDSESGSDLGTHDTSSILGASKEKEQYAKVSSSESSSSDDSSESSDDEEELSGGLIKAKDLHKLPELSDNVSAVERAMGQTPEIDARSLSSQTGEPGPEESSTSGSDSEDNKRISRSVKKTSHTTVSSSTGTSSSDSSSAAEGSSEEDISDNNPIKVSRAASETTSSDGTSDVELSPTGRVDAIPSTPADSSSKGRNGSSSSETLQATPVQRISTANTSVSSTAVTSDASVSNPVPKSSTAKRKRSPLQSGFSEDTASNKRHHGSMQSFTKNAPFQRVPKDTPTDERFSNKYKSYDYADQAHYDLSVTRGKGFTKEKNKKKRGSYRGGPIDISGGRGVKFED